MREKVLASHKVEGFGILPAPNKVLKVLFPQKRVSQEKEINQKRKIAKEKFIRTVNLSVYFISLM